MLNADAGTTQHVIFQSRVSRRLKAQASAAGYTVITVRGHCNYSVITVTVITVYYCKLQFGGNYDIYY
jgi:hypothetical protein